MQVFTFEDGIEHRDGRTFIVGFFSDEAALARGVSETSPMEYMELALHAASEDMGLVLYGESEGAEHVETAEEIRAWPAWNDPQWAGRVPWLS